MEVMMLWPVLKRLLGGALRPFFFCFLLSIHHATDVKNE